MGEPRVLLPALGFAILSPMSDVEPTLRPASPADYAAFARLVTQLGTGDPTPDASRFAGELMPTTIVAEHRGEVVGYVWFEILAGMGYVRHVVVDAGSRGLGLGRALMLAARDRVRAGGGASWCLNVRPDNLPARRLYESLGLGAAYASAAIRFPWSLVDELPWGDTLDVSVSPDPGSDGDIESALGVQPGLLANARLQAGRVIAVAWRAGRPVGVAVFNPSFPGAFPFRLKEASDARRLLEALRPSARPDLPGMGLVIEDAAELLEVFVARGAEVKFQMVHHRGPLPA